VHVPPIYQRCETQHQTRFADISKLASSIDNRICYSLIGFCAVTGCDTVSAFAGRGKLTALVKKDTSCQDIFSRLGQSWYVSDELFQKIATLMR